MTVTCAALQSALLNPIVKDEDRDNFIASIKKFLGPKLYKLSTAPKELEKDSDIAERAKDLIAYFGSTEVSDPENLGNLVHTAKCMLAKEEATKKIQRIEKYQNLTSSDFDYLSSFFGDNKKFCADHGLDPNDKDVINVWGFLSNYVKNKKKSLILSVEKDIDNYGTTDYSEIIKKIIQDTEGILKSIADKTQLLYKEKFQLEVELKKQRGFILRDSKKSLQEAIDKLNAEINILDISQKKLLLVQEKLDRRKDTLGKIKSIFSDVQNSILKIGETNNKYIDPQIPQNIIDDIKEDIDRCKRIAHLAKITADDPSKQLYAKSPVNTFVEVMSLADIHESNQSGAAYFRDEFIDASTQKNKLEKDTRILYGLESNIITRGVKSQPGEIKRTYYVVNGSYSKMHIDTQIVRSAKNGKYDIVKCNFTATEKLSVAEMQIDAFRYAKYLLRQHALGDPNSKIIVKAGKGKNAKDAKEIASYVYAALLMLTSADEYGEKIYNISRDKIIVDVSGMEGPTYIKWQLPWNKTKNFIEDKYTGFTNEVANFKKEIEVLNLNKKDNKSSIDENAATSDASYRPK